MTKYERCACWSKQLYHKCCKPYHEGTPPENALKLMRSRYSAYALKLAEYIIATTHPNNNQYKLNHETWKKELHQFSTATRFDGLKIIEFVDGESSASVTFTAYMRQGDSDVSFSEKSTFVKIGINWLYVSGEARI